MKKLTTTILPLLFAGVLLFAQPGQQGKGNQDNKGRKENNGNQGNKPAKANQKGNQDNNPGRSMDNPGRGNATLNNNGKGKSDNAPGKDRNERDNKGNGNMNISLGKDNLPQFNRENFKNRRDFFKGEKVTICHKAADGNPVTITVSANALQAHLNHGDSRGNCTYRSGIFSDDFWKRRENFFDLRERTRDQVVYSQGILQYALQRLTEERSDLVMLRNQNAPVTVITTQEQRVAALDNNVSLLQTLLGTALTLITD